MPYREWVRYTEQFSQASASTPPPDDLYRCDQRAEPVNGWRSVGPAAIDEFWMRGFLVVANAFNDAELDAAISAISALLSGANPEYRPSAWGRKHGVLLRPGQTLEQLDHNRPLDAVTLARGLLRHDARLTSMAHHPGLHGFLREVMRDDPVLLHDMVRAKPPSHGDKPWHQDLTHFRVHESTPVVTMWIALDDAPEEAGCLYFIPGSHRNGPTKHVFDRDFQIPDDAIPRIGQVAAPVRRGSCVLLHALVHHGSPPNRTADRRLALQLTFKPTNAVTITDNERIRAFAGEGTCD